MTASTDPDSYEIIDYREASLSSAALANIQAWLQPTDYDADTSEYHRHLSSQAPNTGLWILRTSEFGQWHDTSGVGSLWIKGVPGAGKSVIAAAITEHLKRVENVPVLFFFFREIIATNREPRSLVCDWLSQLLPHSIQLQASLQPLLDSELSDVSEDQLWQHLLTGLSSVEKAYCIIDALDEMQMTAQDGFLGRINELSQFRPNAVRIMMTSRPKQYLQSGLRGNSIIHINLQQELVDHDIEAYVLHRLSTVLDDSDLRRSLVLTVSKRSRGLFLYARLLLDQIIHNPPSLQDVDISNLSSILPSGLEKMYDSVLAEQAKTLQLDSRVQVLILELLTHSSRPMRLNEIGSILGYIRPDLHNPKNIARSACGPLLEILEDETVQVIHHSFTEFLVGSEEEHVFNKERERKFPVLEASSIHKRLTIKMLAYLQSGVLLTDSENEKRAIGEGVETDIDEKFSYDTAQLQYPFLHYAVTNWPYHAAQYNVEDSEFFHAVGKFVDPTNPHFRRWVSLEWSSVLTKLPSALHVAAFAGLTEYAKFILKPGTDVNIVDAEGRTPLWWAARRNQASMAFLLLQKGAKPDTDDRYGTKPLHEAAKKNHPEIVKMLLGAGVDLLTPKTRENNTTGRMPGGSILTTGDTPVDYACAQGHVETIKVMLPFASPEALVQILCDSCRKGKSEAVRAVLENSNVSPNSKLYGATPLYLAALAGSVQSVEMLLAKGANVHSESEYLFPSRRLGPRPPRECLKQPLNAITRTWRDEDDAASRAILKLLLKAGANLEYVDGHGNTPLLDFFSRDSRNPNVAAIEAFLEAGSDITATNKYGDTILHLCLDKWADIRTLEVILRHGADIAALGHDGRTIWHALFHSSVCKDNLDEIVVYLLEKGAGRVCLIQDKHGKTALEAAASCHSCDFEAFRRVFLASPDDAARKGCLWSLIASHRSSPEFYRELVSAGISLEERGTNGKTALLYSVTNRTVFDVLRDCGARLDAVDNSGRGVLHYYVSLAGGALFAHNIQEYVDMGLDPRIVDNSGNTLLHVAAGSYMGTSSDVEFIEQLLSYGIDANARNHLGRTALHIYFESLRLQSTNRKRNRVHFLRLLLDKVPTLDIDAQDEEGVTALHISASRSELDVDRLLNDGSDASIVTKDGRNALHIASESGKSNIVALLLERTGDSLKDGQNDLKRTPLHIACRSGIVESVHSLLKSGANIHAKDYKGRTPLHSCAEFAIEMSLTHALKYSDEDTFQGFKKRFKSIPRLHRNVIPRPFYAQSWRVPLPDVHDTRPIGIIVSILIDAGADVIAKDSDQQTPLDLAILYECKRMVESLRHTATDVQKHWKPSEKHATLSTVVSLHQNPKMSVLENPEASIEDVLAAPGYYVNMLTLPDIEFLLKAGADLTAEKSRFRKLSLLHASVEAGRLDIIRHLGSLMATFDNPDFVKAGFEGKENHGNINQSRFQPVLHAACGRDLPNLAAIELLVNNCGVDVNAQALLPTPSQGDDMKFTLGPTALHVLAESQFHWQLLAIRFLVEKGAVVDARDSKGQTPLHIACKGHRTDRMGHDDGYWSQGTVKLLLDLGADSNALDNDGLSPIHKAGSSPDILRLLIQRGADPLAGKSNPLFAAIQEQNAEALHVLLDSGVDPNIIDTTRICQTYYTVTNQAKTALLCASFPGRLNSSVEDSAPLVKLLLSFGADPFAPLNDHETLIHYVFENAQYPVIAAFIEFADKIDLNRTDQRGCNVLHAACKWTQKTPTWSRRVRCRTPKQDDTVVRHPIIQLLDRSINILSTDNEDRNVLHHILDNPHMEDSTILQLLAHDEIKPLLLQQDKQHLKPFHLALKDLRPAVCEHLLSMGCNILEPDPTDGATVLHRIASQYLGRNKVGISICTSREKEQLLKAYREGCIRLWQKFLDAGRDNNVRDAKSSPPLFHYLASPVEEGDASDDEGVVNCCHVNYYQDLFANEASVDIFAVNEHAETALHIIAGRKTKRSYYTTPEHEKSLFEFMMKKGLDPLQEDSNGRSSLDVATVMGKEHQKEGILAMFQYQA